MGCECESDLEAERQSLLQADRDFAAETARSGGDGWADYFAEDGVMLLPSGRVDGREAIRKRMQPVFTDDSPQLIWHPTTAVVGSAGDMGYTVGRWKSIMSVGEDRDSTLAEGNYVTIWQKDPEHGWRVAVDIGNSDQRTDTE
jgi:uncharacterized protein (TIGR02246 family)